VIRAFLLWCVVFVGALIIGTILGTILGLVVGFTLVCLVQR